MKRLFRTLAVATGIVFFWRGAWGLMDLYIHPDNLLVSYIISLLIGLAILYFFHKNFNELV